MRLKNMDSSAKEVIKRMFEALLWDLSSGMDNEKVGWRSLDQVGIDQTSQGGLLSSGRLQRNSKGEVRLNYTSNAVRQELKRAFSLQSEQLEYFLNAKEDEIKLNKAQKTLNGIVEIVQKSPETWKYIVAFGWWRMLESSGMPALVDDVLNEGFSPQDWTIQAVRCASELALSVSGKLGQINEFNEAIDFLRQIKVPIADITLLSPVDQNNVQRIKKILKWTDIEKELTEPVIKSLGFLWSSFLILDVSNLFPTSNETTIKLYKVIWDAIETLLGKSRSELLNELWNMMSIFELNQITWASDIIRIPEAM